MIDVRFKHRPDEWVRHHSHKEILDMERWGLVLEVRQVEDEEEEETHDESPVLLNPQPEVENKTAEPEAVATPEHEEKKQPKRYNRKTSSDSRPKDEQE